MNYYILLIYILVPICSSKGTERFIYPGDTIALMKGTDQFLECASSKSTWQNCQLATCSKSFGRPCSDTQLFHIAAWLDFNNSASENRYISSGDAIALQPVGSDLWFGCTGPNLGRDSSFTSPANCRPGNCRNGVSVDNTTFFWECPLEEFYPYAPSAMNTCDDIWEYGCRGLPLQDNDTIFLWHDATNENDNFYLAHNDKTITTGGCPGRIIDSADIEECPDEKWTIKLMNLNIVNYKS